MGSIKNCFDKSYNKESLIKMEKQGLLKLGSGKLPKDFWTLPRPEDTNSLVLTALLEEREKGR